MNWDFAGLVLLAQLPQQLWQHTFLLSNFRICNQFAYV